MCPVWILACAVYLLNCSSAFGLMSMLSAPYISLAIVNIFSSSEISSGYRNLKVKCRIRTDVKIKSGDHCMVYRGNKTRIKLVKTLHCYSWIWMQHIRIRCFESDSTFNLKNLNFFLLISNLKLEGLWQASTTASASSLAPCPPSAQWLATTALKAPWLTDDSQTIANSEQQNQR